MFLPEMRFWVYLSMNFKVMGGCCYLSMNFKVLVCCYLCNLRYWAVVAGFSFTQKKSNFRFDFVFVKCVVSLCVWGGWGKIMILFKKIMLGF